MPALSAKTKHYYREHVRSLLVQNPMTSGEGIRKHLEQQDLILDRHYIVAPYIRNGTVVFPRHGCEPRGVGKTWLSFSRYRKNGTAIIWSEARRQEA